MSKPNITIRANSEEQKEKWKTAVRESDEYDSLSHLIRRSVERELASGGDSVVETGTANVDDLRADVDSLRSTVETLATDVSDATDAMYAGSTLVDDSLTADVYDALPQGPASARSTYWISEEVGRDETTVRVALEQLARSTAVVNKVDADAVVDGAVEEADDPQWFRRA